jgi:DNA-binding CsgD family transcriptional regulator
MRPLGADELRALALFAEGRSAEELSAELGVSKSTAVYYLRVAARKLGARNQVHAVAIVVRMGLVDPSRGGEKLLGAR